MLNVTVTTVASMIPKVFPFSAWLLPLHSPHSWHFPGLLFIFSYFRFHDGEIVLIVYSAQDMKVCRVYNQGTTRKLISYNITCMISYHVIWSICNQDKQPDKKQVSEPVPRSHQISACSQPRTILVDSSAVGLSSVIHILGLAAKLICWLLQAPEQCSLSTNYTLDGGSNVDSQSGHHPHQKESCLASNNRIPSCETVSWTIHVIWLIFSGF